MITPQAGAAKRASGRAPAGGRAAIASRPAVADDPAPREAGTSQDVITQAELVELTALERRRREIDTAWKSRSQAIRERLEAGAAVQAGPYRARLTQSRKCQLTFRALERLLGAGFVRELKSKLEVRRYTSLNLSGPR